MNNKYLVIGFLCLAGIIGISVSSIKPESDSTTYSSTEKSQSQAAAILGNSQQPLFSSHDNEIHSTSKQPSDALTAQQQDEFLQRSREMQKLREEQQTLRFNYASTCRNTQLINPYHDCSEYDDVPMTAQYIKAVSEGAMSCSNLQVLDANHDCSGYEHLARQVLTSAERHGQLPSDISEFEQPATQSTPNVSPHIQERMYDDSGKAYDENTDYIRGS